MPNLPFDNRIAIQISLAAAEKWRNEGNVRWECTTLSSALTSMLRLAVAERATPDNGLAELRALDAASYLRRASDLNAQLFQSLKESGKPAAAVDDQITLAHLAVMLGRRDLACHMLEIAVDPQRLKFFPLTKFWNEYARGFLSLSRGEPFSPTDLKLKGYEKYWMPYLALMSALTHKQDIQPACSAIDGSFASRNGVQVGLPIGR